MINTVSSNDTLTLPMPMKMPQRRGVESLFLNGRPIAVRLHESDLDLLHQEARHIGLNRGELIRWLCVYGAAMLHLRRTGETVDVIP